jgi:protein-S-isoprenylcysteine O-methyltransferase Ste14
VTLIAHFLYGGAWALFGFLHSITAGAGPRRGLGRLFGPGHRLAYNALALIEISAVMRVGERLGNGGAAFKQSSAVIVLRWTMLGLGLVVGISGLRAYRLGPFVGLAQLGGEGDGEQPLVIDGLHHYMRHPLYTAALLLLWGRVSSELSLATAIWGSLYLLIGSSFEERRLVARYGGTYASYRDVTPRFIPRLF